MPVDQATRETMEAFLAYIEDSVSIDDRYGPAQRQSSDDGSTLATFFEAGRSCWLTVTVFSTIPQIHVGFLTDDPSKSEEVEQAIKEAEGTMEQFVGAGFAEAGLDWKLPTVEHDSEHGQDGSFATPLEVEELADLDTDEVRDKTLRMLEGYLIAFGPAIIVEDEEQGVSQS